MQSMQQGNIQSAFSSPLPQPPHTHVEEMGGMGAEDASGEIPHTHLVSI